VKARHISVMCVQLLPIEEAGGIEGTQQERGQCQLTGSKEGQDCCNHLDRLIAIDWIDRLKW
jgi:hypothetical protein